MKAAILFIVLCTPAFFSLTASAQNDTNYIRNGSAKLISCNCYSITQQVEFQSGSVWNKHKIDLTQPFDYWFNVFLGCIDNGADGMVFMLQPLSTNVGSSGEGMGFSGVQPSIGIPLDTYQNFNQNDPPYDHISIQANGNPNHSFDLAGPVPASASSPNIKDCKWHKLRISWNPSTKWLRAYFDDVLRVQKQIDLVSQIFYNDPMVYWGFSGATGGRFNDQQFCTALNPQFKTNLTSDTTCAGINIHVTDRSQSFAPITNYFWDFGDGVTSTAVQPPDHVYSAPGIYIFRLAITGQDGCQSDTLKRKITVGSIPDSRFSISDTCLKKIPRIRFTTTNYGVAYQWKLNGALVSDSMQPRLNNLAAGSYQLQLQLASVAGCGANDSAMHPFTINALPRINSTIKGGCVDERVLYSSMQTDTVTTIQKWFWNFGDNHQSSTPSGFHVYRRKNVYTTTTWALATNGCSSDTLSNIININRVVAKAGRDTLIIKIDPTPISAYGEGNFLWTPSTGLNDATLLNPVVTIDHDQTYVLTASSPEGCVAKDSITISVFKGSTVFVPNAFTPNGDGKNDVFRPSLNGIKKLNYFNVYNRWGELVFSTSDKNFSWDGKWKGQPMSAGSYVWILKAVDLEGKFYQLRGTVTLIR